MGTDLPKRFVLYHTVSGVIGHGVEYPDGGVALRRRTATILYRDLGVVLESWCKGPFQVWVIQYDDEPIIEDGRGLMRVAGRTVIEPIASAP